MRVSNEISASAQVGAIIEAEGLNASDGWNAAILGCSLFVMPHPDKIPAQWRSVEGWKNVAVVLNRAAEPAQARGLRICYHNHDPEFLPLADGRTPIEIIAQTLGWVCGDTHHRNILRRS